MTTFQVVSDVHVEFNKNIGLKPESENLILAGDIVPFIRKDLLEKTYKKLKKQFKNVFHIPGNHEYYDHKNHTMEVLITYGKLVANKYGIVLLDNSTYDIGDSIRIIGSTLWSETPDEVQFLMNDYKLIRTERGTLVPDDTLKLHHAAVKFIEEEIDKCIRDGRKPLLVTHHAPWIDTGRVSISNFVDKAYSTDLTRLFVNVPLWVYGHTHRSCDLMYQNTRLVSNAKGYPGERTGFRNNLTVIL